MAKDMAFEDFKAHFDMEISKSLCKYVTDVVLKSSRYLFFKNVMDLQYAYCTHCNQRHRVEMKLQHRQQDTALCPHCKSVCQVRAERYGRKYMEDKATLVWYERSKIDPKAITARVISVRRNYSGTYEHVETQYNCSHMYLFMQGESHYMQLGYRGWEHRKTVYSAFDKHYSGWNAGPKYMSPANIRSAVKGTPFQYSTWDQYIKFRNPSYISDMVEFFDLAARYPCIEYMTKMGLKSFVEAKLYGEKTYGAINWFGKSPQAVLRLTKVEIKEMKNCPVQIKPKHLRYYQNKRKQGQKLSFEEAYFHSEAIDSWRYKDLLKEVKLYTIEDQIKGYVMKQIRNGHYSTASGVISDWYDYIRECKQLGMSLKEERYLYPNNLNAAHQKTSRRIKLKADLVINQKIAKRVLELKKLCFESNGLLIRPAASSIELFDEGKALHHCVGGYAKWYAEGSTDIFLIRKSEAPEEPFYTLEVSGGKLRQCQGYKHCEMTKEVRAFVDLFMSQKLLNKKRKKIELNHLNQQEAVI